MIREDLMQDEIRRPLAVWIGVLSGTVVLSLLP
jgi:hypothetical protein